MAERADDVRQERDLFRRILELDGGAELEVLLGETLELLVQAAGASRGYIELRGADDAAAWALARGLSQHETARIREGISGGILGHAIHEGETVNTASAIEDTRFSEQQSVMANRIQAVLCAPIGRPRAIGAVYLQGRDAPGPFSPSDQATLELLARHLGPLLRRARATRMEASERDPTGPLRATLRGVDRIVGRSQALADVLQVVTLVAPIDVGVLITGPSGTGKTEIARVIHANHPQRRSGPFVELNCAAIPEGLVESELFGAERGSHATATRRMLGKVEAADGGTLFLDEVGELPLSAQAKLLQLLQSKTYYSLGSTTPKQADARVLAATNVDLDEAVRDKRFREDLLHRLRVLPLHVPGLEERREDIEPLARHFCGDACSRYDMPRVELSPGACTALENAPWSGNIRQLLNTVEAGVIRARGDAAEVIEARHLFPGDDDDEEPSTFQGATRGFQRRLIVKTLDATGWNVAQAARDLDVARSYLYDLINAFGLKRG